jgi:hypothetical protein
VRLARSARSQLGRGVQTLKPHLSTGPKSILTFSFLVARAQPQEDLGHSAKHLPRLRDPLQRMGAEIVELDAGSRN